jgi:hypothetical protein
MVPIAFNALFLCSWLGSQYLKTVNLRDMIVLSGMKRTVFHTKQSAGSVMENVKLQLSWKKSDIIYASYITFDCAYNKTVQLVSWMKIMIHMINILITNFSVTIFSAHPSLFTSTRITVDSVKICVWLNLLWFLLDRTHWGCIILKL